MEVPEGPGGTRDKPTLVPSMFGERIVGCICEFCVLLLSKRYMPATGLHYMYSRRTYVLKHWSSLVTHEDSLPQMPW